jgi:hypothetical protein
VYPVTKTYLRLLPYQPGLMLIQFLEYLLVLVNGRRLQLKTYPTTILNLTFSAESSFQLLTHSSISFRISTSPFNGINSSRRVLWLLSHPETP